MKKLLHSPSQLSPFILHRSRLSLPSNSNPSLPRNRTLLFRYLRVLIWRFGVTHFLVCFDLFVNFWIFIVIWVIKYVYILERKKKKTLYLYSDLVFGEIFQCVCYRFIGPCSGTLKNRHWFDLWMLLQKFITSKDQNVQETPKSSHKTIEIEKGDTLWGLSREHGVSFSTILTVFVLHMCLHFSWRIGIHEVVLSASNCGLQSSRF